MHIEFLTTATLAIGDNILSGYKRKDTDNEPGPSTEIACKKVK
jgi:hypothetical protein